MLEKEPSGTSHHVTLASQPVGATPGGPFSTGSPLAQTDIYPSQLPHSYTLQFLIAVIKKPSK